MAHLAIVGATIAERPGDRDRRRRGARRPTACWPSSPTSDLPQDRRPSRTCCPRCSARPRPARASSRCRTTSCTTPASRWRWSSPRRTSGAVRRLAGARRLRGHAVGHHDRRGPRPRPYEAERLFGGLMPGAQRARRRRGRRSARADVRVEAALPDGRQPPQPDGGAVDGRGRGRAAGSRSTSRPWASAPRQLTVAQLLGLPLVPRPGDRAVRRRRIRRRRRWCGRT